MPFENFAALSALTHEGGAVSPLQLVVAAVEATHTDYSVFGSKLIEILLEFKWNGFAKQKVGLQPPCPPVPRVRPSWRAH